MERRTHAALDPSLCGTPVRLAPGEAEVRLETRPEMAADDLGLVHGGFLFGLADHAAMLAVNHPNVVLVSASCRFLAPSRVGEELRAVASCLDGEGRRRHVAVEVRRDGSVVFDGEFVCQVPERHVLELEGD